MREIRNYVKVQSLEEAYQLNQTKSNHIIGGMLWLRTSKLAMGTAIDLCNLGLDKIEETKEQFSIGAMVSLRALELNKALNEYSNNGVRDAVKDIVGVQFRNMATVGGSIWGRFGFSDVLTVFLSMDTYVELYKGGIMPL
ncbi:MAG: FAD binding domain-containing protein, partial [Clostridia bacterium]|nr:FAD binding domain-containing protein [Clostridia bacterium]